MVTADIKRYTLEEVIANHVIGAAKLRYSCPKEVNVINCRRNFGVVPITHALLDTLFPDGYIGLQTIEVFYMPGSTSKYVKFSRAVDSTYVVTAGYPA